MHRVYNYGSILQAYATQAILTSLGYQCKIIDYQYPNKIHPKDKVSLFMRYGKCILQIMQGFPEKRKQNKFKKFYKKYLNLTMYYPTKKALERNPPEADIYIVGSDQTWNTRHIGNDTTFLLSFVPKRKQKMSFSSSAARLDLEDKFIDVFKRNLNTFSAISVRETNTQTLIKKLLNKDVPITLDPTLLLDSEKWSFLAKNATVKIKKPYILVYILKYSFYPYPLATQVIEKVYEETKYHVVCLRYSVRERLRIKDVEYLNESVSPEDFVYLFQHASFVITSSFHGTAFSLVFNKPFYSIVNPAISDDRILSLLNKLGIKERGIADINNSIELAMDYTLVNRRLEEEKQKTIKYLIYSLGTDKKI